MIDRRVLVERVSGNITDLKAGDTAPFSALLHVRNIILLGDPGSGKTELFKSMQRQYGGRYTKAASFIIASPVTDERVYYIDALDERRSPANKAALTDQITDRLWTVLPEKFRLSSRKQDWLGDTDLEIFRDYFDMNGGYIIVSLLSLSDNELISILTSSGVESPQLFIEEARARKMDGLLHNPQNAVMLARAVSGRNSWPLTRRDVFSAAVDSLLSEHNRVKAVQTDRHYTADELRDTAGELCALRLIADLPGYRLHDDGDNEAQGLFYRHVRPHAQELVSAVLKRPAFRAADDSGCIDCVHRTVAEFLGGQWLASRVDSDLAPARLDALLGRDGHPVIAMRGLWAWMPVFSRVHPERYILADPLGVLTNGDVHSLTTESKRVLLKSLQDYALSTPWFSTWGEPAEGLKALGIPELQEDIIGLLVDEETSDSMQLALLRMITPDLIRNTSIRDKCRLLVETAEVSYSLAEEALTALFYDWNANCQWIRKIISAQAVTEEGIRLRACALSLVPSDELDLAEPTRLLLDILVFPENLPAGTLYSLHDNLCAAHALSIIKAMADHLPDSHSHWVNANEVGYLINIKIYELLRDDAFKEEQDIIICLKVLRFFSKVTVLFDAEKSNLRDVIFPYRTRLILLAKKDIALNINVISEFKEWADDYVLNSLNVMTYKDILKVMVSEISKPFYEPLIKNKIYCASMNICLHQGPEMREEFEALLDVGAAERIYYEARDLYSSYKLSDGYFQLAKQRRVFINQREEYIRDINVKFERGLSSEKEVEKINVMRLASDIYWGQNAYVRDMDIPHNRMEFMISPHNFFNLKKEWRKLLFDGYLYDSNDVVNSLVMNNRFPDGLVLLTAAEIYYQEERTLQELDDKVISVLLVLELTQQVMYSVKNGTERRSYRFPWLQWLNVHRLSLVGETLMNFLTYVEMSCPSYHHKNMIVRRLLTPEHIRLWMQMLSVLRHDLDNSIDIICASLLQPENFRLLTLTAEKIKEESVSLPEKITDMWDALEFLTSETCDGDGDGFIRKLALKPDAFYMIRELAGLGEYGEKVIISISPEKLEKMISSMIPLFPIREEVVYGVVVTERSLEHDGEHFISRLLSVLAADSSAAASGCLSRLAEMHKDSTYRDDVLQARQSQIQRRRELEYISPAWTEVRATLQDQQPANAADLHALLCDRIEVVAKEILHGNTDNWKLFWNEGSRGAVDSPKSENSGTDVMITLLKPHLRSLDISLQPEMHMALDKRADIGAVYAGRMKILIEVKRNYHPDVWTAAENQLQKLYTPDPDSDGYGIFLVFWFGGKYSSTMPLHPKKSSRPGSAEQMCSWLNEDTATGGRAKVKCFVINVSGDVRA
jgi:hypothetical protein